MTETLTAPAGPPPAAPFAARPPGASPPRVLAFVPNRPFLDPDTLTRIYAAHTRDGRDLDRRAGLNRAYLFFDDITGRRLRAAFGERWSHAIAWEWVNPGVAAKDGPVLHADPQHMACVIRHHAPAVVLAFGPAAGSGLLAASKLVEDADGRVPFYSIVGPDPADRRAGTLGCLDRMYESMLAQLTLRDSAARGEGRGQ